MAGSQEKTIRTLLETSVSRTPDKVLFAFKDQQVTYSEVLRTVSRIANGFLKLGIKKGDRVAILLPNCLEFPFCWLAANMIGAVMAPVNNRFLMGEAKYILNHSEAKLLVTSSENLEMIGEIRSGLKFLDHIINIDNHGREEGIPYSDLLETSAVLPPASIEEEDLAVLLYTSGTTGNPKGCMASHYYCVNLADIEARLFDLGDEDRVYTAQPFYYMDPQWNTLMVMTRNATLAFAEKFSTSKFWDEIRRYGVTCFYCIGSMTSFLFNMPPSELDKSHNLKLVQTSGIHPRMHKAWEERFNVPVYEVYASTETACDIAVTPHMDRKVGTACIGRPVYYREAKIVDENEAEVKPGEVGEIVLKRARGMMTGYYKDPEATEHAFRGGWFHSGDLAYKDEDGDYHFVGRKKDIIRRGGENISAPSLEQVLMSHPKIIDAAVIPVPDKIRGEEVKAYVVLKPNEAADYQEIVSFCEQNMAAFKVPRYYEFRESLPKTPSERVQKRKLIEEKPDLTQGTYDRLAEEHREKKLQS
jgi:carnitine-CoA ligase